MARGLAKERFTGHHISVSSAHQRKEIAQGISHLRSWQLARTVNGDQRMQNVTHRPAIDFHAHMLEGEVLRRSVGKTVVSGYGTNLGGEPRAVNESTFKKMLDPQSHIEEMDRRGIDINVIFISDSHSRHLLGGSTNRFGAEPAL